MREMVIVVACDLCGGKIHEAEEGSHLVRLSLFGEDLEMDVCNECARTSFLQEARLAVKSRARRDHICSECGRAFTTVRGLSRHRTVVHGGSQ